MIFYSKVFIQNIIDIDSDIEYHFIQDIFYSISFWIKFVFMVWGRETNSYLCVWISSYSSTIHWKKVVPHSISRQPCQNQLTMNVRVYFWIPNTIPLMNMSILVRIPHCFDYYNFLVGFEVAKCEFYSFVLFLQDCFVYSGSLEFPYEF